MTGFNQFMDAFGSITVGQVAVLLVGIFFLYAAYRKLSEYLIKRHEAEKEKDEQLAEALTAVRKYPEYRQQSVKIQQELKSEIQELRIAQQANTERLVKMEEATKLREVNKLRDRLLQSYRYYTNKEANPSQCWTRMESEAFWELFKDYENMGGNGYVHTEVQPAMERLTVVEVGRDSM